MEDRGVPSHLLHSLFEALPHHCFTEQHGAGLSVVVSFPCSTRPLAVASATAATHNDFVSRAYWSLLDRLVYMNLVTYEMIGRLLLQGEAAILPLVAHMFHIYVYIVNFSEGGVEAAIQAYWQQNTDKVNDSCMPLLLDGSTSEDAQWEKERGQGDCSLTTCEDVFDGIKDSETHSATDEIHEINNNELILAAGDAPLVDESDHEYDYWSCDERQRSFSVSTAYSVDSDSSIRTAVSESLCSTGADELSSSEGLQADEETCDRVDETVEDASLSQQLAAVDKTDRVNLSANGEKPVGGPKVNMGWDKLIATLETTAERTDAERLWSSVRLWSMDGEQPVQTEEGESEQEDESMVSSVEAEDGDEEKDDISIESGSLSNEDIRVEREQNENEVEGCAGEQVDSAVEGMETILMNAKQSAVDACMANVAAAVKGDEAVDGGEGSGSDSEGEQPLEAAIPDEKRQREKIDHIVHLTKTAHVATDVSSKMAMKRVGGCKKKKCWCGKHGDRKEAKETEKHRLERLLFEKSHGSVLVCKQKQKVYYNDGIRVYPSEEAEPTGETRTENEGRDYDVVKKNDEQEGQGQADDEKVAETVEKEETVVKDKEATREETAKASCPGGEGEVVEKEKEQCAMTQTSDDRQAKAEQKKREHKVSCSSQAVEEEEDVMGAEVTEEEACVAVHIYCQVIGAQIRVGVCEEGRRAVVRLSGISGVIVFGRDGEPGGKFSALLRRLRKLQLYPEEIDIDTRSEELRCVFALVRDMLNFPACSELDLRVQRITRYYWEMKTLVKLEHVSHVSCPLVPRFLADKQKGKYLPLIARYVLPRLASRFSTQLILAEQTNGSHSLWFRCVRFCALGVTVQGFCDPFVALLNQLIVNRWLPGFKDLVKKLPDVDTSRFARELSQKVRTEQGVFERREKHRAGCRHCKKRPTFAE